MNHFAFSVETFNGKILATFFSESKAIEFLENFPSNNTFIGYHTKAAYDVMMECDAIDAARSFKY